LVWGCQSTYLAAPGLKDDFVIEEEYLLYVKFYRLVDE
jgi:hypothetical protein